MEDRNACVEIRKVHHLIARKIRSNPEVVKAGKALGSGGFFIGYLIQNKDKDVFQRDLEKEFNLRRSTITGILSKMEENGIIIRQQVEYDSRLKKIVLTEKAYSLHEQFEKNISDFESKINEKINKEDLDVFYKVIDKITELIDD